MRGVFIEERLITRRRVGRKRGEGRGEGKLERRLTAAATATASDGRNVSGTVIRDP